MRRRWCAVRKTTNHYRKRPISGFLLFTDTKVSLLRRDLWLLCACSTFPVPAPSIHSSTGNSHYFDCALPWFWCRTSDKRGKSEEERERENKGQRVGKINYRKQIFHSEVGRERVDVKIVAFLHIFVRWRSKNWLMEWVRREIPDSHVKQFKLWVDRMQFLFSKSLFHFLDMLASHVGARHVSETRRQTNKQRRKKRQFGVQCQQS